jgi:hypothetical protein
MRVKVVHVKNLSTGCWMVQPRGVISCHACKLCNKQRIFVCLMIETEEHDVKGVVNDGIFYPLCGGLRPPVLFRA